MSKIVKEDYLGEKQKNKRKQMQNKMEKEIQKLEYDIEHPKTGNTKKRFIRGLKISLRAGQLVAPYVLTASLTFAGFAALGGTPFIRDNRKMELNTKATIDSFGNVRCIQQYDSFDTTTGTIFYYGEWIKQEDGFYKRTVKSYTAPFDEFIQRDLIDDNEYESLDELCGAPNSVVIETKNNLTEDELKEGPYLEGTLYSKSKDEYIIVKEPIGENILITFLWVLLVILGELVAAYIRSEHSDFDFEESVKKIKRKHPLVSKEKLIQELKTQLEIKKENYKRLQR